MHTHYSQQERYILCGSRQGLGDARQTDIIPVQDPSGTEHLGLRHGHSPDHIHLRRELPHPDRRYVRDTILPT